MSITESLTKRRVIELKKLTEMYVLGMRGHMTVKFYFQMLMTGTR